MRLTCVTQLLYYSAFGLKYCFCLDRFSSMYVFFILGDNVSSHNSFCGCLLASMFAGDSYLDFCFYRGRGAGFSWGDFNRVFLTFCFAGVTPWMIYTARTRRRTVVDRECEPPPASRERSLPGHYVILVEKGTPLFKYLSILTTIEIFWWMLTVKQESHFPLCWGRIF